MIHRLPTLPLHSFKKNLFPFQKKKVPQPFLCSSFSFFSSFFFPIYTARDPPYPCIPGSSAAEWNWVRGISIPEPHGDGLCLPGVPPATGTIRQPGAQCQPHGGPGCRLGSDAPRRRSCHQPPGPAQQSMLRFNPGRFSLPCWPQNSENLHLKDLRNTQAGSGDSALCGPSLEAATRMHAL